MRAEGQTNLWHGIKIGLERFKDNSDNGSVLALMVLTDGQPNHGAPRNGYMPGINSLGTLQATIHTFGFGYEIDSGLLKSIAELGGGNYAFIPDAGMIGIVFIHAVAHLQSTYATKCAIEITSPASVTLRPTAGQSIEVRMEDQLGYEKLTINLGNLQYGQSRDIYLRSIRDNGEKVSFNTPKEKSILKAKLSWSRMRAPQYNIFAEQNLLEGSLLTKDVVAYHQSRSMLCDFLSSFFPLTLADGYKSNPEIDIDVRKAALQSLLDNIPARHYSNPLNQSIMEDFVGSPPAGQVGIALSTEMYYNKWDRHYFLSLWNAHAKQLCNSFKNPGPQKYNDDRFFIKCRETLDKAFDNLHPPTPSYVSRSNHRSKFSMRPYRNKRTPCFTGSCKIELADGREIPVLELRKGMLILTPRGNKCVDAVLQTWFNGELCKVGDVLVTEWHLIRASDDDVAWVFFRHEAKKTERYSGYVYSVLLERDSDVDAHAVKIGGVWGVTLGHGLVHSDDLRAHPFFGDYQKVKGAIEKPGIGENGVSTCIGVERGEDGLIHGFVK